MQEERKRKREKKRKFMICIGIHKITSIREERLACQNTCIFFINSVYSCYFTPLFVEDCRLQLHTGQIESIPIECQVGLSKYIPIYTGHSDKNGSYPKGYVYRIFTVHVLRFRIN